MLSPATDPYAGLSQDELVAEMLQRPTWRHHHGIPQLQCMKDLYMAYVRRVGTMYRMIDDALRVAGVNLKDTVAADIATAEGFVAFRYAARGLKRVDCFEYSQDAIDRFQMVRAYKEIDNAEIYRCDLSTPDWSQQFGGSYPLVFCLGIVYHMEDPFRFLRNVAAISSDVCIIESDTPKEAGERGLVLRDSELAVSPTETRRVLEMRPSRNALRDMVIDSGFKSAVWIEPPVDAPCPYLTGKTKSVLLARK